jgi:hypothetical protein
VVLVSVVLSFANPFGFRAWAYAMNVTTAPEVVRQVIEWRPPTVYTPTGFFFFGSLLVVAGVLARRSQKTSWIALLTLGVFACVGLIAIRGVGWWALVAPVVVAGVVRDEEGPRDESRPPSHLAFVLVLVSLVAMTFPWDRGVDPVTGGPAVLSYAPESLVSAAEAVSPPGTHVFASGLFSSWTELSAPALPVAVDARIEIFPEHVWKDYFIVAAGREGWDEVLERWRVRTLILESAQATDLLEILPNHPEWRLIARNAYGAVFART